MREEVKFLHAMYGFGACINKAVHKLFHDEYGYTGFTPDDFLDFITRIKSGEFDGWFDEQGLQICINSDYVDYLTALVNEFEELKGE